MWFIVSLRLGDGELCIAGEKDVICLVKINRLLKALIQNVYPAPVLHYDTGYGTVEAEEIRIGLFSRVCRQGNALAAKLHGGDRERFQPVGSVLAPAGTGFQGDGFGQQLNLPIIGTALVNGDEKVPFALRKHTGGRTPLIHIQVGNVQIPCGAKLEGTQAVPEGFAEFCHQIFGIRKTVAVRHIVESSAAAHGFSVGCAEEHSAIAVLSLLPCAYFVYLLVQTGDIVFWGLGLALFVLASPCQTGLHSVCVRLVHRMPVWVKDEFINAWKQERKPSMLLGLILGVLWSVLAYGAYMVVAVDGGMSVGYLLMMLLAAYFLTGLTLFGYQQIAMLELPFGTQLKNAALLIFAGKLRAFFAIAVWVGMLLVPVIYYGLAAYILLAGWVAIGVMTANVIFAPVFSRLFLTGEPE